MLAVGASGETLIKGTHNKSINKTVVWGYSDRNETWSTLSKEKNIRRITPYIERQSTK